MLEPDIIHVIPPYLLHTCLGLELERELALVDPALAQYNFFPVQSSKYRFRTPTDIIRTPYAISEDPEINRIIMEKLHARFTAFGLLGSTPGQKLSNKELYELYEQLGKRLIGAYDTAAAKVGSGAEYVDAEDLEAAPKATKGVPVKSIFNQKGLGEFRFEPGFGKEDSEVERRPLEELLAIANQQEENKFFFFPYLMIDNHKSFLSPLPMYWTSLSVSERQWTLEKKLNMSVGFEDGYSVLNFSTVAPLDDELDSHLALQARQYFNFISDKEVKERTGIFYYEVTVEQKTTKSIGDTTIIQINDESVSSGSCIVFSAGYSKRATRFTPPESSTSTPLCPYIDLQNILQKLLKYDCTSRSSPLDPELAKFLSGEPGVTLDGSVAVSFNNSCSYAPIKQNRDLSNGGWGRRLSHGARHHPGEPEISDLGIDIPFSTTCKIMPDTDKLYTSDVVGFGVNFIAKTLFITVNGIIVKVITDEEMKSGSPYKDSIFSHGTDPTSLYPTIGFQLSRSLILNKNHGFSQTSVRTNFGQRNFKFDIDNYVQSFKASQDKEYQQSIGDAIESQITSDSPISNPKSLMGESAEEHVFLQYLIESYLSQKGYLDTLDAYKLDLADLASHVYKNGVSNGAGPLHKTKSDVLMRSQIHQHYEIRSQILKGDYDGACSLLQEHYSSLPHLEECRFELALLSFLETVYKFTQTQPTEEPKPDRIAIIKEYRALKNDRMCSSHIMHSLETLLSAVFAEQPDEATWDEDTKIMQTRLEDALKLAEFINSMILGQDKVDRDPRLESMVNETRKNISELTELKDDFFKLLNFDREYLN